MTLTLPSRIIGCELVTDDNDEEGHLKFNDHCSLGNSSKRRNNR